MSVEYIMEVYRESDDKKLAEFICNELKSLFNFQIEEGKKWKMTEFNQIIQDRKKDIESHYEKIVLLNMKECLSKNRDVRDSILEDMECLRESIESDMMAVTDLNQVVGKITLICEDLFKNKKIAYEYNLPQDAKDRYYFSTEDAYIKIRAEY